MLALAVEKKHRVERMYDTEEFPTTATTTQWNVLEPGAIIFQTTAKKTKPAPPEFNTWGGMNFALLPTVQESRTHIELTGAIHQARTYDEESI